MSKDLVFWMVGFVAGVAIVRSIFNSYGQKKKLSSTLDQNNQQLNNTNFNLSDNSQTFQTANSVNSKLNIPLPTQNNPAGSPYSSLLTNQDPSQKRL
jgi:hypothetical protein